MSDLWLQDPRDALRVGEGFDLSAFDRAGPPGFTGDKAAAATLMAERGALLSELQERLYANGRSGGTRNVLVIVQGLDTAGKGGIARHVMGMVDPQGVALRSFGVPTAEERSHHYLWRIKKALPRPGLIGLFDRSHYEDVLVVRVDELVPPEVWEPRYNEINKWEKSLVDNGTIVLKFAMMVSHGEQGMRLMERIDRPDKRWKYSVNDLPTRLKWDDYQQAYSDVFERTSTEYAPWYVLPADRKWYPRLAVTEILTRSLIEMDLRWPKPRWRPDAQRRRLVKTMTPEQLAASLADTASTAQGAIDESVDVNLEAAKIRDGHADQETRDSDLATIASRRSDLETDLATTLEQKRALLEELSPELAAASAVIVDEGTKKKGKESGKGKDSSAAEEPSKKKSAKKQSTKKKSGKKSEDKVKKAEKKKAKKGK